MSKLLRSQFRFLSPSASVDHLVVGAGVVGLAIGERLRKGFPDKDTFLVERYYPPRSLKTHLCIRGRNLLYSRPNLSLKKCGKLILATTPSEVKYLDSLVSNAKAIGGLGKGGELNVPVKLLSGEEVRKREESVGELVLAALESPETGILGSHDLMDQLERGITGEDGEAEGEGSGMLAFGSKVVRIDKAEGAEEGWVVQTVTQGGERSAVLARVVVNAAGLSSHHIFNQIIPPSAPRAQLYFAKGSYHSYRGPGIANIKHLLYPCPSSPSLAGLGTHLTLDLDGNVKFGPDVQWLEAPMVSIPEMGEQEEEEDFWHRELKVEESEEQLDLVFESVRRWLPGVVRSGFQPDCEFQFPFSNLPVSLSSPMSSSLRYEYRVREAMKRRFAPEQALGEKPRRLGLFTSNPGGMSLQDRIDQLRNQLGANTPAFHEAVGLLMAQSHHPGGNPYAPVASTSAFPPSTPSSLHSQSQAQSTPQTSSRGRTIKPTKPFTPMQSTPRASPAPSSLSNAYARPGGSSLNPNAPRAPTRVPLSSSAVPVPPLSRISEPRYQALHTTYPARMRLGTSSLMQPNAFAASGTGSNTPGGGAGAGVTTSKRGRVINYAEMEGLDDSDDESNDSDVRAAKRAAYGGMLPKRVVALGGGGSEKDRVWGDGKSYLGVLPPGNLVMVQSVKPTKHTPFSEDQLEDQAEANAVLVPIQIDIDVDTFKIRDSFVWNLNEKLITPESFARIFCDDLDIPSSWVAEIAKQITDQVEEQTGVAEIAVRSVEDEAEHVEKDLRVILNLDVQIGTLHLLDRVEWDLSSPLTPELFALTLVRDLSLSSSAAPLIAHALHEELFRQKKLCLEMGLVGEDTSVAEVPGKKRGAKQLEGVWRDWPETMSFGPRVEFLSLDEMDRVELDREREKRRAKRDRLTGSRTAGRRR
ncbi:chromatin structure-remodeling complex subunit SFH1, partial [Phenoliferia sp. Uapishka_3]